ncbi:MAG: hypothetical protein ABJN52_04145 [Litorimonas sp.]
MNKKLNDFLELCERIAERMEREGSWPWTETPDSTLGENLVDSED